MTICIDAKYWLPGEEDDSTIRATLLLSGDLHDEECSEMVLTILHERAGGPRERDIVGRFHTQIEVSDRESLTLLVRSYGEIIAGQVFQVDTSSGQRLLLQPKFGHGLALFQVEAKSLEDVGVVATVNQRVQEQALRECERIEISPASALLLGLVEAIEAHYAATPYPLPEVFRLLWSAVKNDAACEEGYARDMLLSLVVTLESVKIHQAEDIKEIYDQAQELLCAPSQRP